jgi:predicted nucleic acid-binding protein
VNLVVDTHALVWYLSGQHRRLSARARRVFSAAGRGRARIHVPVTVLMEVVLLEQLGRLRVSYGAPREQVALRLGFPSNQSPRRTSTRRAASDICRIRSTRVSRPEPRGGRPAGIDQPISVARRPSPSAAATRFPSLDQSVVEAPLACNASAAAS